MKSSKNKQTKIHVKIGEKVTVISGNHKGFVGIIESISKKRYKATLVGLAPRMKDLKKPQSTSLPEEARKKEIPTFIHISNLMAWDEKANLASRKGQKLSTDTKKQYYKKSKNLIE